MQAFEYASPHTKEQAAACWATELGRCRGPRRRHGLDELDEGQRSVAKRLVDIKGIKELGGIE